MSEPRIIATGYEQRLEDGEFNDAADEEIVMGWLENEIKAGDFNGAESVIVDDEWFADLIDVFLRYATGSLKKLEVRSAYYSGGGADLEERCLSAMTENDGLSGLEQLSNVFYSTPAEQVRSTLSEHEHLHGLTVTVGDAPIKIGPA